jgi:hypothetical protein
VVVGAFVVDHQLDVSGRESFRRGDAKVALGDPDHPGRILPGAALVSAGGTRQRSQDSKGERRPPIHRESHPNEIDRAVRVL